MKKVSELLDSFLFPQLTFNYFKKCIFGEKRREREVVGRDLLLPSFPKSFRIIKEQNFVEEKGRLEKKEAEN